MIIVKRNFKSSKRKTAKGVPAQICGIQARQLLQRKPLPLQSFPRYIWLKKELKNKNFCISTTFDVSLLNKKLELVMKCHHCWKTSSRQPTDEMSKLTLEWNLSICIFSVRSDDRLVRECRVKSFLPLYMYLYSVDHSKGKWNSLDIRCSYISYSFINKLWVKTGSPPVINSSLR